MEKEGGVRTMTRGYFREAIGVILVYDTSNLESLNKLRTWVDVTQEACIYSQHLVFAMWGNEKGAHYSSVCSPVRNYNLTDLIQSLPVSVEDQLVCRMNGTDQMAVANNYETLIRTIRNKIEEINTAMKEVSQRVVLNPADVEGHPGDGRDDNQSWCMQFRC